MACKIFESYGGQKVWLNFNNKIKNQKIYFQKIIIGEHISVQFLVKKKIKMLCFCKQHFYSTKFRPFIINGLTTIKIDDRVKKKILSIVTKVSKFYKLNGLNSIDTVIDNKKNVNLVEINPRPGLSFNLLSRIYGKQLFNIEFDYKKKIQVLERLLFIVQKSL